jgi:hypothetical protein
MTETTPTYCYAHPGRETGLRCRRCDRPICASCAQRVPTGYLCKDCVSQHKKIFDTALWYDYLFGFITMSLLSFFSSGLLAFISAYVGFFMIFLAFAAAGGSGTFFANIALRVTGKRRSRSLFAACAASVVVGALPIALFLLYATDFYTLIVVGIYTVVVTSTVYSRLAGI